MIKKLYNNMKLKNKLFFSYFSLFLLFFVVVSYVIFKTTSNIIEDSIERQLMDQSERIKDTVEIAAETSIRNHLRTISNTNLQYCEYYYSLYLKGQLTEKEAQEKVLEIMKIQKIGQSGYLYIIDSNGILKHHAEQSLIGQNIRNYDFVQKQVKMKNGYIEYQWKNPSDATERPKSLSMSYFKPWDWIISASSYRSEFAQLIKLDDFKSKILSIQFGKSGYITVLDYDGKFLIHPSYEGRNLIKEKHPQGSIVSKFITGYAGYYEYDWQNSYEKTPRKKLTIVSDIPEYRWLVASTSYKDEFYTDIAQVQRVLLYIAAVFLMMLFIITYYLSSSVTKPLRSINRTINEGANGNLAVRVNLNQKDEIGSIGNAFNQFLSTLQQNEQALKNEIQERQLAQSDLAKLNENLEELVRLRTQALNDSLNNLKKTQEELIRTEKYLVLGSMVSTIGHHLNTPLGNVLTATTYNIDLVTVLKQKFEENKLTAKDMRQFLEEISISVELQHNCIRQSIELIDAFKLLKNGNVVNHNQPIPLNELINKFICEYEQIYYSKSFHFTFTSDSEIVIEGYMEVYEMILDQLLTNAVQHGFKELNSGVVTIEVNQNDTNVFITVSDNGVGISEKHLARIFEPFYTTNGSMNNESLGLGLNLVYKSVVEVLGGKISIDSDIGKGTIVEIVIPIA